METCRDHVLDNPQLDDADFEAFEHRCLDQDGLALVECVLSCPPLSCPALSCPVLPCPTLPGLPCPALPCLPALPCPALPCPVLHTVVDIIVPSTVVRISSFTRLHIVPLLLLIDCWC
eukprot:COSAG06_NODE_32080_length_511_cov_2.235437_1_plen_117_part_01